MDELNKQIPEVPIIIIERDEQPQPKEVVTKVVAPSRKQKWLKRFLALAAIGCMMVAALAGYYLWNYYYNIGVSVSVTPEQNIEKLQKRLPVFSGEFRAGERNPHILLVIQGVAGPVLSEKLQIGRHLLLGRRQRIAVVISGQVIKADIRMVCKCRQYRIPGHCRHIPGIKEVPGNQNMMYLMGRGVINHLKKRAENLLSSLLRLLRRKKRRHRGIQMYIRAMDNLHAVSLSPAQAISPIYNKRPPQQWEAF